MKEKELDYEDLDTAISLGDAVCGELGICCEKRGRVIYQIYRKLEDMKPRREIQGKPEIGETLEKQVSPASVQSTNPEL
jgi:hypothetical protein